MAIMSNYNNNNNNNNNRPTRTCVQDVLYSAEYSLPHHLYTVYRVEGNLGFENNIYRNNGPWEKIHMLRIERNTDPKVSIRTGLNQIYVFVYMMLERVCVRV